MNPDKQARDDGAVKILAYLFNQMCEEDDELRPAAARRGVNPMHFAAWLQRHIDLKNGVEVCGELGVPAASWDFVHLVASSGNAQPILTVWPRVVLGDLPDPKHPLASMHLVLLLEWEDGHLVPISMYLPRWFAPDAVLTDGIVAAMVNQQVGGAVKTVMDRGLDGMHEHMAESYGGEKVFDVLMGAMLKVIPQLDPALQPYLHKWMRLFQGLVRPPVPPELKAQIEAAKRRLAAESGKPAQGGWD